MTIQLEALDEYVCVNSGKSCIFFFIIYLDEEIWWVNEHFWDAVLRIQYQGSNRHCLMSYLKHIKPMSRSKVYFVHVFVF